jgi:hypothetical protein
MGKHMKTLEMFKFFAPYPFNLFFKHLFILREKDARLSAKSEIFDNFDNQAKFLIIRRLKDSGYNQKLLGPFRE